MIPHVTDQTSPTSVIRESGLPDTHVSALLEILDSLKEYEGCSTMLSHYRICFVQGTTTSAKSLASVSWENSEFVVDVELEGPKFATRKLSGHTGSVEQVLSMLKGTGIIRSNA